MAKPADQLQAANARHVPLLHHEYDRKQQLLGHRRRAGLMRIAIEHPLAVARFGGNLRPPDWLR